MHVFCDFDGTISRNDTTDLVLTRFGEPAWTAIEADWEAGRIDAATCMALQIPLVAAPLAEIDALLDTVALTDGFHEFLAWTRAERLPLTIVSDGVDYFIHRILARHGIRDVPVIANRLVPGDGGRFRLEQPHRRSGCGGGSGVCKCAIVDAAGDRDMIVFVGDGRSDFCVSALPDLLFATGRLTSHCVAEGTAHIPFTTFHDVQATLTQVRAPRRHPVRIAA